MQSGFVQVIHSFIDNPEAFLLWLKAEHSFRFLSFILCDNPLFRKASVGKLAMEIFNSYLLSLVFTS